MDAPGLVFFVSPHQGCRSRGDGADLDVARRSVGHFRDIGVGRATNVAEGGSQELSWVGVRQLQLAIEARSNVRNAH